MSLSEDDTRQLLKRKAESKNLDYKERLNWDKSRKDEKLEIVKDVLAMANTQDGGNIVFGVRDSDFEFTGMPQHDFKSFDQTKLNDFLHKYTDPKHSCQTHKYTIDDKHVVAIHVPEFEEVPIVCKADAHSPIDPNKQILKKGQIYVRTNEATSEAIPSVQEMRELLGRALTKKGDELLHNIERLIKGKPSKASDEARERYNEEIREADKFFSESIGAELKNRGYWAIYAHPTEYDPNRIPDQPKIKELIARSEVKLTGWTLPFTHLENASNFAKGRQSYIIWERFIEGYRAYKSGLFIWKRAFWEDVEGHKSGDGKPVLSFVHAIWLITQFFLFFKRYYEQSTPESDVHVRILLNDTKDRKLEPFDPLISFHAWHIAKEQSICIEEDVKVVDLRASYKEIANRVVRHIYLVFNWDDVSEKVIDQWQTKLLEGKA